MTVQWLQEKTWQDVSTYLGKDRRIILPVGSTEQHGLFRTAGDRHDGRGGRGRGCKR
jgi:hypothetical protein